MADNLTLCLPRPSSGMDPKVPVLVSTSRPENIPANHIVINVDRFGFSMNNVTYQALGEQPHFRYFDFHAAPNSRDVSPEKYGLVPVWGFGTVAVSRHPRIKEGERVYGYLAPTRYLLVEVSETDVNKHAFYVSRPHLPADRRPYNQILRCSADPQYSPDPRVEDLTMLYRPLFWTSYWFEDWLYSASNYRNGSSIILISSASSKTAFTSAYLMQKRRNKRLIPSDTRIIGLTSSRNVDFTRNLNLYDEVVEYDSLEDATSLKSHPEQRVIYVDVAGNESLNKRLLSLFSKPTHPTFSACIALGMTNLSPSSSPTTEWTKNTFNDVSQSSSAASPLSPEQFFMPEWLNVRKNQLSPAEIFQRQDSAWKELMKDCDDWIKLERVCGGVPVQRAYDIVASGQLPADKGYIWSMWDDKKYPSNAWVKL